MTTIRRPVDLTAYASVLPYASELSGVYQPLLGWKSSRIRSRFGEGYERDRPLLLDRLKREFSGLAEIERTEEDRLRIAISAGILEGGRFRAYDSVVLQRLAASLPAYDDYQPRVWASVITQPAIDAVLSEDVVKYYSRVYDDMRSAEPPRLSTGARAGTADDRTSRAAELGALAHHLQYESAVAGMLLLLVRHENHDALRELFYASKDDVDTATRLARMAEAEDALEAYLDISHLNPRDQEHLRSVALSPISVVHLFRQYFFELDTFLGTPEGHVWLSPGSSVELIEVHTRRTTVEKTLETTLDILTRTETTTASRRRSPRRSRRRTSRTSSSAPASPPRTPRSRRRRASTTPTRSSKARETTHKRMRQQTEKLSSEIRKNFKSTFKTVDGGHRHRRARSTSWRTPPTTLVNYELRRKMRQVGVQVQDIGTYLCWQTYVDDPGAHARRRQADPHRQAGGARRHPASGGDPAAAAVHRTSGS